VVQPQLARLKTLDSNMKLARASGTKRNDD
jgi:hypothetical protein